MTDEAELYEPLSIQEVAEEIGCSENALYTRINNDQIPYKRINKKTCVILRKDIPKIKASIETRTRSKSSQHHELKVSLDHIFSELHNLSKMVEDVQNRMTRMESKFHMVHKDKLPYDDKIKTPTLGDKVRKSVLGG